MKKFYVISFLLSCISWICYGQNAIIVTERSGTGGVVSFTQNSKLTGIGNQKFVDGYVKKYGSGQFIFPVGDNGIYRPFAAEADGTLGAYFQENPNTASVPGGGPFSVSNKESSVSNVSTKEFWDIWGNNGTRLTLSWNAQSDISNLTGNSLPHLSIVGWNQTLSRWEKIASAVDEVNILGGASTLTSGSITTIQSIVPKSYNIYALAALSSVSTPVNYSGVLEVANCTEIKGYVWDQNYPDAALTVEIMNGSTVFATATANIYRADLQSSGKGTGKYGFSVPMPANLMDGQAKQISVRVRGSNYVVSGSPQAVTCAYEGSFEVADCNSLRGWAMDNSSPDKAFTLEIMEGNTVRATVVANLYREDLKNAGKGTGNYGFDIPLPASLKTGQAVQLSVRVKGTTYLLPGSAKTITCGAPQYYGSFEVADCNIIQGWAWAGNYPDLPLTIELMEGTTVHATAVANIYRQYLKDYNIGTGKYGFSFPLPASLKSGQARQLSIRVQGSTYILPNSPKTVTCAVAPQLYGKFEIADCNSVQGWAYAGNYPDSAFTVELMEGSVVRATGVANIYRQDLKNYNIGTGKYGFNIPLPASLKSGQARPLSVRVMGSTYILPVTSPKSVTCAAAPQYYGILETADCNTIYGWAWASNYPDSAFTVELVEGNTVHATAVANIFRQYLVDYSIGTGKYGFSFPLPASLKTGQPRQLNIRFKGSTYVLPAPPKTVTCAVPPQLYGKFEIADCNSVQGWVYAGNYPDSTFTVELMEGSVVRATGVANIYRQDLKNYNIGTGKYGFNIPLPASLKSGQARPLSVRVKGSTYILPVTSPKSVTCAAAPQYYGILETADCNTIYGWAWASNYPDSAFTVELVEGNTVHATAVANIFRQYLVDYNIGTGKYGFSFPLPASLKSGQPRQLNIRFKGSTYVLPAGPKTVTCAVPPQLYGKFEIADCNSVQGWVYAGNYPDSAFTVELMEGSTVRATGIANIYRADLKTYNIGTAKYGFNMQLPASLKSGQTRQLSVRVKGSTYILPVTSPKSVTCAAAPQYYGSFEMADCNTVQGWAWAGNYPDSAFTVELVEGNTVYATAVANIYRQYLKDYNIGTGKYGFSFPLPASLKSGQARQLSIRFKGSTYNLPNSPKTVTCAVAPQYYGKFEIADCNSVQGWAWAGNYPDSTFTVELMEGNTVHATGVANIYRADLQNAAIGTGKYGFNIPLPASLKNGQARQLSVRFKGSTYTLPVTSAKVVTCAPSPQYYGSTEFADCNTVQGWVWAGNYPDSAFTVELVEGNTVHATATANIYREFLKTYNIGTGKYGFSIPLPATLKNGQSRQVSIRVKGSTYILPGSPKTVNCGASLRLDATNDYSAPVTVGSSSEIDLKLLLSPNPTSGKLNIKIGLEKEQKADFLLYNTRGDVIWQKSTMGLGKVYEHTIDLSQHAAGAYLFKLQTREKTEIRHVVLVR